jgi:predicted nucleic acid-binding protein
MSGYLLDTDWMIDFLNDQVSAVQMLPNLSIDGVAVSVITYGETFEGAYYARNQFATLTALEQFMSVVQLLPLSTEIVERFGILRGAMPRNHRQQVGDLDLLIAPTAISHDLTIVTRNIRDFKLIPGVRLFENAES